MANPKLTDSQFFYIQSSYRSKQDEYNKEIFKLQNQQEEKQNIGLLERIYNLFGLNNKSRHNLKDERYKIK